MKTLILILFICTIATAQQTAHYVDKEAGGNNDGTSWTDGWESFADISWGSVDPGDTVFISGGTDSLEYNEYLAIGASGTYGNLVVVRPGWDVGHNGRVILVDLTSSAITAAYHDYFRIEKLETRNCRRGVEILGTVANPAIGFYIDSCRVIGFAWNATGSGIFMHGEDTGTYGNIDSAYVRYNYVRSSTPEVGDIQKDCLGNNQVSNHSIIGNTLVNTSEVNTGHSDCTQVVYGENVTIRDNIFIHLNSDYYHDHQGLMLESLKGDFHFYNNVVYYPEATVNLNMWWNKNPDAVLEFYIYNNTFIGKSTAHMTRFAHSNVHVKNNIFFNTEAGGELMNGYGADDWSEVDGNLYGINLNGTPSSTFDGDWTMAELNALGAELSGTPSSRDDANPLFVTLTGTETGNDFNVSAGSPCINAGVDLGAPYNVDINGTARPDGEYTIGALQYVASDTIPTWSGTFTDIIDAELSTEYTSNTLTFTEFDSCWAWANGSNFSVNDAPPVAVWTKIYEDDEIYVTQTSSGSNNTTTDVVLTVSTSDDTYSVTTKVTGDLNQPTYDHLLMKK